MRVDLGLGWVPVRTAALMMQVSRTRVYQLIKSGELKAIQQDKTWLVNRGAIDRWVDFRSRRHRYAA